MLILALTGPTKLSSSANGSFDCGDYEVTFDTSSDAAVSSNEVLRFVVLSHKTQIVIITLMPAPALL